MSTTVLLLAGVTLNAFFSALILFVQYLADFAEVSRAARWLMGDLDVGGFDPIVAALPLVVVAGVIFARLPAALNLMGVDPDSASSRGVDVRRHAALGVLQRVAGHERRGGPGRTNRVHRHRRAAPRAAARGRRITASCCRRRRSSARRSSCCAIWWRARCWRRWKSPSASSPPSSEGRSSCGCSFAKVSEAPRGHCCRRGGAGRRGVPRHRPRPPAKAQRIVSLVPAVTEMLFAIGAGPAGRRRQQLRPLPSRGRGAARKSGRSSTRTPSASCRCGPIWSWCTARRTRSRRVSRRPASRRSTTATASPTPSSARSTPSPRSAPRPATRPRHREVVVRITTGLDDRAEARRRARPSADAARHRTAAGTLQGVYAAGGSGFLNEMLEIAGGQNVFEDVKRESVQPSSRDAAAPRARRAARAARHRAGGQLPGRTISRCGTRSASIPAVRDHRVHAVVGDFVVVAGPRLAAGRRGHRAGAAPRRVQVKILLSWSSGKDSAWALHVLRRSVTRARWPGCSRP